MLERHFAIQLADSSTEASIARPRAALALVPRDAGTIDVS